MAQNAPCMRDADDSIHISQRRLQELAGQDSRSVINVEAVVICEDNPNDKEVGVEDILQ
jgi:hypothetical protein